MKQKIYEGVLLTILVMVLIMNFLLYAKSTYMVSPGDTLNFSLLFLIFAALIVQTIVLLRIANKK
ncbi:MAG: hypothetical protein KAR87_00575 [Candidatus Aenigmarchaeota archaeon]|nr:hypothetical protein [Candidatus Aenigmarchaeota archaeon]MCK5176945.1 hypothetical protein [Candidatus Aenigmarchaeota archaeon]